MSLKSPNLSTENRFTPIYDFGYVAMNFGWVYPEDSGEYVCRATNLYGTDETRGLIKTTGRPGIVYESQVRRNIERICTYVNYSSKTQKQIRTIFCT